MAKDSYTISGNILWEEVSQELVLFKLDAGQYYRFNNTGLIVWKGIVEGLPIPAVVKKLQSEFGVEASKADEDVQKFIDELLKEKLIAENE